MEKNLIIVCCLILGWVFYDYPVFDSEGISYLIIFGCFIVITFSAAKIFNPTGDSYESVEKKTDELENFDGIFSYKEDGFSMIKDNATNYIKWTQIVEANFFTIPFLHEGRHTGLEIITEEMSYEFNDEQTPGINKFVNKLSENLPYWNYDAQFTQVNNHGLKKANLFKRNNV